MKKILILEDNAVIAGSIETILKTRGYEFEAIWVTDVDDAKRALSKGPIFDLVISDFHVCGTETGMDLWLFCLTHFPRLPFILTSSDREDSVFKVALADGNRPIFLQKPFTGETLVEMVNALNLFKNRELRHCSVFR